MKAELFSRVEVSVRAFFTSDKTGLNIAPSVIAVVKDPAKAGEYANSLVARFQASDLDMCSVIDAALGKGFCKEHDLSDIRYMTPEEVEEYRADE